MNKYALVYSAYLTLGHEAFWAAVESAGTIAMPRADNEIKLHGLSPAQFLLLAEIASGYQTLPFLVWERGIPGESFQISPMVSLSIPENKEQGYSVSERVLNDCLLVTRNYHWN